MAINLAKLGIITMRVARNSQWRGAVLGVWGRSPQRSKILHFLLR